LTTDSNFYPIFRFIPVSLNFQVRKSKEIQRNLNSHQLALQQLSWPNGYFF